MGKIRVGIIGVGNCASALVQGIEFYKTTGESEIGLMHQEIGGYKLEDITFTSAFDVGENKVGKLLSEAIYEEPNLVKWVSKVSNCDVVVKESPILDGVGIYVENKIKPITNQRPINILKNEIIDEIKRSNTEILINYLPVGSQLATEFWAEIALETGCGFVNCIPVFIASNNSWAERFAQKGIPVIGDDIKAVVGATIVHRALAKLCADRGTIVDQTYQINVGGNTDFLNLKEVERLESKKISKTEAVQSVLPKRLPEDKIYVGPSDFIPQLGNTKIAFIKIQGRMFANIPFTIELRLEVDDKANSAGIAVDAIRCCKLALDRGLGGALVEASAWLMKHPPKQIDDSEAKRMLEYWISAHSR
ncbi:MAG: inositol-3-phosphate synthase [Nitrososphaerales archaeon]